MPANGERLSAVARQRRLRGARVAESASASTSTSTSTLATPSIVEDDVTAIDAASGRSSPNVNGRSSEDDGVATSNQFTTLVDAAAVQYSGSREVEVVNARAVKIRLSRGQKCIVLGTCAVWVKQGSVALYGAILHASATVHALYAPGTHALPPLCAVSATAEVQLQSLDDAIADMPYMGIKDLWPAPSAEHESRSFRILGHSWAARDAKSARRVTVLNVDPWADVLAHLTAPGPEPGPRPSTRRILLCGRRSSGLSTFTACLLNRLLTRPQASPDDGVLLLDLDSRLPEFTPPGTISLVRVTRPALGPSFTHVLSASEPACHVLRLHFVGDVDAGSVGAWHVDRMLDLFHCERQSRSRAHATDAPLVVLAPRWIKDADDALVRRIWQLLTATDIVGLDARPTSPYLQRWSALVDPATCQVHQVQAQPFDKLAPAQETALHVQSYFHRAAGARGRPIWTDTPVLAGARHTATLSYGGDDADVGAIVLLDGHVALEDTMDALDGSVVALVAVPLVRPHDTADGDAPRLLLDVVRTDEGLPRLQGEPGSGLPFAASDSHCIGLALVTGIDIPRRRIHLIAAADPQTWPRLRPHHQVAVVRQKAAPGGAYPDDWVRREMRALGKSHPDG